MYDLAPVAASYVNDRARLDAAEVIIEILDDGPGPTDAAQTRAFERGFSTRPGSSGIGLALASDIARELGGGITLEPRWPKKPHGQRRGAVLRLRFPAAPGIGERKVGA